SRRCAPADTGSSSEMSGCGAASSTWSRRRQATSCSWRSRPGGRRPTAPRRRGSGRASNTRSRSWPWPTWSAGGSASGRAGSTSSKSGSSPRGSCGSKCFATPSVRDRPAKPSAATRGRGEGGSAMITTTRVYRQELSPVSFLERAGDAHADRVAVQDGERAFTYRAWRARSRRLASALRRAGLEPGDRVAFLALNSEPLLLAHMGVPQAGGILVAVNTRLNADEVRYIMEHSGPRFVFYSPELRAQLAGVPAGLRRVDILEEFEHLLGTGSDEDPGPPLLDEEETIAIDYTSGTTGRPKGVMYTHRGAYMNAIGEILETGMTFGTRYLWTLPMFHCNGWCFPWAVTAVAGVHLCLRRVDPGRIWEMLDTMGVTHYNGAPTVHIGVVNHPTAHRLDRSVTATVAGAPPSPTLLAKLKELNFRPVHVSGLTETYGPHTVCGWHPEWDARPLDEQARLAARQGQGYVAFDLVRVVDEKMIDVPRDGQALGEVVMRGNNVMKGYFAQPDATAEAFRGGWFHSGDIAVWHPDGYIELRDRKKDIIIS